MKSTNRNLRWTIPIKVILILAESLIFEVLHTKISEPFFMSKLDNTSREKLVPEVPI